MTPAEQQAREFQNIVRVYRRGIRLDGETAAMFDVVYALDEAIERLSQDPKLKKMLDGLA